MKMGPRFLEALPFVAKLHEDQIRKGSDLDPAGAAQPAVPYVAHLLGVASLVLEAGGDEDEAIAALCHDAIEDHPRGVTTEREIASRFGERVLAIVKGCTKEEVDESLPPEERRAQRRAQRSAYFEHLRRADASVLMVSAADKLHNARAILADLRERGPSIFERFNDDREGTLWYYRGVLGALRDAGAPRRLVDALDEAVEEVHRLADAYLDAYLDPVSNHRPRSRAPQR